MTEEAEGEEVEVMIEIEEEDPEADQGLIGTGEETLEEEGQDQEAIRTEKEVIVLVEKNLLMVTKIQGEAVVAQLLKNL